MMKTTEKIGMILVFLGIAAADSPSLLVPAVMIGVGAWMLRGLICE